MVIDGPNWCCKVCGDKKPIEEKKVDKHLGEGSCGT